MGYKIELRDQDGTILGTIGPDNVKRVQLPRAHSQVNRWQAVVPPSPSLESYRNPETFIYYVDEQTGSEELIYRGEFHNPTTPKDGDTTMEGLDVTRKLKRGGRPFRSQSEPAADAIRRYASEHTQFDVEVIESEPEVIGDERVVQSSTSTSLGEFFDPEPTDPFRVTEDDDIELLQTCFVAEAEDADRETDPYYITDNPEFSGGGGQGVYLSTSNNEYDFTPQHTIPSEHVGVWMRMEAVDDTAACEWVLEVDGSEHQLDEIYGGEGTVRSWTDFGTNGYNGDGYDGPDLAAGETVTVKFCGTTDNGNRLGADVVALTDNRFAHEFDNDNGGNGGYLDGPELYPDAASVLATVSESDYNVAATTIDTSIDDTSGGQALAASNDGGDTYISASNTETLDASFDTFGTTIQARVTLGRTNATRDTATPREGFEGQTLTSWEVRITTNDRSVFDDREFSGSSLDILQEMHEASGRAFVALYREDALPLVSFAPGDIQAGDVDWAPRVDWVATDHERSKNSEGYANVLTARGATDDEGDRLEVTARAEDAIAEDGGEIPAPPVDEPKIDSKVDLQNLARQELQSHLAEGDLAGSVEIVPKADLVPGVAYQVAALDDEWKVLEEVSFESGGGSARGELAFEQSTDLASQLASISSSVKSVKDVF